MANKVVLLSEFKQMDIIDINSGKSFGKVADFKIDVDNNSIISIFTGKEKGLFKSSDFKEIKWEKINKIGIDTILVDI